MFIFDRLDEHDLGSNEDVHKILEGRKLLSSSNVLTSRPDSTDKIARFFPILVRVYGFSCDHAEQFIKRHVENSDGTKEVLSIHRNNFAISLIHPSHFSPMFLSFMCILISREEWGFGRQFIRKGEIYFKLVRVLYERYCERKKKSTCDVVQFVEFLRRAGTIAWEMLKKWHGLG